MCMCAHVSFYVRLKMVRLRLSPVCSTCLECLENSSTPYNLKLEEIMAAYTVEKVRREIGKLF